MCGIAGIVHPHAGRDGLPRYSTEIRAMTSAIAHRGPDGEGFFEAPGLALGSRRLQIIDLAGGAQPMCDATGAIWVVYNGEIYNHLEVRAELESRGFAFKSHCDTEVLVHGYRAWGSALVERLNGMFAFAVWDAEERSLLLARDRMGQKPLFYSFLADGRLLFNSEVKGLLVHPELEPRVDEAGLASYLTFEYFPGELSVLRGVRKLPPAHTLRFAGGRLEIRPYWDLPFDGEEVPRGAVERFVELFDRAVESQLMADVPLGIFLSGGIDSSAVAASAVRARPPESVSTFAISFDDPSFDESAPARRVAEHLGTRHHEQRFQVATMRDVLPQVVERLDEPFGDASLLPTFMLSRFAREHVKVALGGDGGDELLLGYPTFWADGPARLYRRLPDLLRRAARRQVNRLPVRTSNFSWDFIARTFVVGAEFSDPQRHPLWLASVVPGFGADPLHPELRREFPLERVLAPALAAYAAPSTRSHLQRLSYQYCKTYLAEDILHKVDRASMAVSLEARSPFLDRDLVEFIASLPVQWKLSWAGRSKLILRRAFADRLPSSTLARKKKGFGIPVADWLKGPLFDLVSDLLAPDRLARAGFFEPAVVSKLVDEHRSGRGNHRKVLWTLLSFELWRERHKIGGR
jgi:asparagine synthase (glutamine-hydrolysing)